jgi:AraC-like DNA-binding protein
MDKNEDKYKTYKIAIPTELEDVFSHFYCADNKSTDIISKTLLPSYQTILIFKFGEKVFLHLKNGTKIQVGSCCVLGPIKQAFEYSIAPNSRILVANFIDDAFYRFFGSASVAEHLPINPDNLLDENCFTTMWSELNKIEDVNHQVNFILDFCKPYLRERNVIAEKLINFKDENLNPNKYLASQQNQTERNIQLNHKKYLGYTSKEINRYQRFLKAIQLIQNIASTSTKIDWFKIINECGYYDQSQLIHDFKHFLNISPTKYLKFQQDICIAKA